MSGTASRKFASGAKRVSPTAFVVELAAAQELQLRPVERVAVNLPMVQLDRADGLLGREEMSATIAQAQVAHERLVLAAASPRSSMLPIARPLFDLMRAAVSSSE